MKIDFLKSYFISAFIHLGVLCLDNYDITDDGIKDLIIGRSDGLVEVYGYDETESPVPRFTYVCKIFLLTFDFESAFEL